MSKVRKVFLKNNALYSYKKFITDEKQFDGVTVATENEWEEVLGLINTSTFVGITQGTTDVTRMNTRMTMTGLMIQVELRSIAPTEDNHVRFLLIKELTRDGNHISGDPTTGDLPRWNLAGHGDTGTGETIMAPHSIFSGKKYTILWDKTFAWPRSATTTDDNQNKFISKKFKLGIPQVYSGAADTTETEHRISLWLLVDRTTASDSIIRMHWQHYYVDNLA